MIIATAEFEWSGGTMVDFNAEDLDEAMNKSIAFLLPQDKSITLTYGREVWDYDVETQQWTPDLDNELRLESR